MLLYASILLFSLWILYYLQNELNLKASYLGSTLVLIIIFLGKHLEREMLLGNVNVFLLILASFSYLLVKQNQQWKAGLLLGIVLLVKIHFLILLPYFLFKKKWIAVISLFLTTMAGLLLPSIWKGITGNRLWIQQWIETMQAHNQIIQENTNTIYGMYKNFIATPLNYGNTTTDVIVILFFVGIVFLSFLIVNFKKHKSEFDFIEYFILVSLIPNLTNTDTQHFLFTWPLIGYIVFLLVNTKIIHRPIYIGIMVLAFVPYCLNTSAIIGQDLGLFFDRWGFIGMANLLIIGVAISLIYQRGKTNNKPIFL